MIAPDRHSVDVGERQRLSFFATLVTARLLVQPRRCGEPVGCDVGCVDRFPLQLGGVVTAAGM